LSGLIPANFNPFLCQLPILRRATFNSPGGQRDSLANRRDCFLALARPSFLCLSFSVPVSRSFLSHLGKHDSSRSYHKIRYSFFVRPFSSARNIRTRVLLCAGQRHGLRKKLSLSFGRGASFLLTLPTIFGVLPGNNMAVGFLHCRPLPTLPGGGFLLWYIAKFQSRMFVNTPRTQDGGLPHTILHRPFEIPFHPALDTILLTFLVLSAKRQGFLFFAKSRWVFLDCAPLYFLLCVFVR